jgi:hypothetical protein
MTDNVLSFYESVDFLNKVKNLKIFKHQICELDSDFKNELKNIVDSCKKTGLIHVKENLYCLTKRGEALISKKNEVEQLKAFVIDYINKIYPQYASLIKGGREKAAIFLPDYLRQILNETKIFVSIQSYHEFTKSLVQAAPKFNDCRKKEIGTYGEELSIKYEKKRVKKHPKWIAAEDDGAGYDLESSFHTFNNTRLFIEVKTTTMPLDHGAIYISRNEWETAKTKWNCYLFHIWVTKHSCLKPFIFKPTHIKKYIPKDGLGGWWCDVGIKVRSLLADYKEAFCENTIL